MTLPHEARVVANFPAGIKLRKSLASMEERLRALEAKVERLRALETKVEQLQRDHVAVCENFQWELDNVKDFTKHLLDHSIADQDTIVARITKLEHVSEQFQRELDNVKDIQRLEARHQHLLHHSVVDLDTIVARLTKLEQEHAKK